MTIWTIFLMFIGLSPALLVWLKERRMAKLALAELNLAKSVTAMEEMMHNASMTMGEVCHDVLFVVMQRIQYNRTYTLPWNVLRHPTAKTQQLRQQLQSELAADGCKFRSCFVDFNRAYYEAFGQKHPWQQKMHFCYMTVLYVSAKGVMTLLMQTIHLMVKWQKFYAFLEEQFFVQAGAFELQTSSDRPTSRQNHELTLA